MTVPLIGGLPVHLWLGFLLMLLLAFQVMTGRRIIKLPFRWHQLNAGLIILVAVIHALIGLGINFWGFTIR